MAKRTIWSIETLAKKIDETFGAQEDSKDFLIDYVKTVEDKTDGKIFQEVLAEIQKLPLPAIAFIQLQIERWDDDDSETGFALTYLLLLYILQSIRIETETLGYFHLATENKLHDAMVNMDERLRKIEDLLMTNAKTH